MDLSSKTSGFVYIWANKCQIIFSYGFRKIGLYYQLPQKKKKGESTSGSQCMLKISQYDNIHIVISSMYTHRCLGQRKAKNLESCPLFCSS